MRRLIVLAALCLAACDGKREPERGVDTSPLADEPTGKITGRLSYPSDGIPEDIDVCAETLDGKTRHCGPEISGINYILKVPAGIYRVYSYLQSEPTDRAYYSQFVRCGSHLNCPSHEPITVTVEEGQTVGDVEPGDWYPDSNSTAESASADKATEDDYYEPNPEPAVEDNTGTDARYESKFVASRARARASVVGVFSTDDYPQSAIRNGEQGTTGVTLTIGPDGRVSSCDVTASSGSSALDNATCNIIRRRTRFEPARDEAGNPVSDTVTQRIRWELPDE